MSILDPVEVDVGGDGGSSDKLIREVVIGPSAKDDVTERSVKRLMRDMNLGHVGVRRSAIPFRTNN